AAWFGRRGESPASSKWGAAIGLGLGYAIAHAAIREWLTRARLSEADAAFKTWWAEGGSFPLLPLDVVDWLPSLAVLAVLLGLLDGWRPSPSWARWENYLLLTALTLWLVVSPFAGSWDFAQSVRWFAGLGLAMFACWSLLDARADRLGRSMPMVLLLMA